MLKIVIALSRFLIYERHCQNYLMLLRVKIKCMRCFKKMNSQIDDFTQNKLSARYENILEYNQDTAKSI